MPCPNKLTFETTEKIFSSRWNFPNVVGCLDGKHIRIRCPSKTGSLYFNYKNYYSIILFALCDANCKFLAIDVGSYGREGDAGIFQKSHIGEFIRNDRFDLPDPKQLPNSNIIAPHVFLGDEAFPLLKNLLKPFRRALAATDKHKAIFNYRLSRARRLVENSFGLLANRFRIFHTVIDIKPTTLQSLVTSACIIHNILLDETPMHENGGTIETECNNRLNSVFEDDDQLESQSDAIKIRNIFKDYFNGAGAVSWQDERL